MIFTPVRGSISNYHPIENGKSFPCGDFKITPYLMDYSAFDSYALKKVVRKLKPGKIIPIHTFHPDKYADLFNLKIEQILDEEIFVV